MRCWDRLLSLVVREEDKDASITKMMFTVCICLTVLSTVGVTNFLNTSMFMDALGSALCGIGPVVFIGGTMLRRPLGVLVDILLTLSVFGLCILDWGQASRSRGVRAWTFVVLALDCTLVVSRDHMAFFIIAVTLLYVSTETVESTYRYGFYDIGYWGVGVESSQCNCASPPCTIGVIDAGLNFGGVCTVFLMDFYLTRGFATGMRRELRRVESSVAVAEEVAEALASYDVDTAETAIAHGSDLPEELAESFRQL
eukprot:Hpha_TRINITY_DN718_c0_g1::TRINITY_DN718_c0_g1_i1::g.29006::m.29006